MLKSYEELTRAQKSLLLNFSMINNAYLIEMLANYNNNGMKEGAAMRRVTAVSLSLDAFLLPAPNLFRLRRIGIITAPKALIFANRQHTAHAYVFYRKTFGTGTNYGFRFFIAYRKNP